MQYEENAGTLATVAKLLDSLSSGDVAGVALYLQRMDDAEVTLLAITSPAHFPVCNLTCYFCVFPALYRLQA
jgi:hypothetical protein